MSTPPVIQTSKLIGNSRRPRKAPPSQAKVDAIVESIRSIGRIVDPLLVRPADDGCYEIVDGEVRWLAAKQLGIDIVPVQIIPLDDYEGSIASVMGNMVREPIDPSEVLAGLESTVSEFGVNTAGIVMEHLPELQEIAASNPEYEARINALLASCGITPDEENTDEA
ncbi:TPA: ParB N-terminal domain-containing protein [Pseudomonas aeruginosa]|nr:ParB N-terminal domain-containing protein [Pseudomonas aeruginosa]